MEGQQYSIVNGDIRLQNAEVLRKSQTVINRHSRFNYWTAHNMIHIQMVDPQDSDSVLAETSASLTGIALDKFTSKQLLFRIPAFLENSKSFIHPLTHIKVSFYLESNRGSDINDPNKQELFNSIMTI